MLKVSVQISSRRGYPLGLIKKAATDSGLYKKGGFLI
jgi:hypothetical protein